MDAKTMFAEKTVIKNFINGKFVEVKDYIDSYDPSTGEVWAQVPDSNANDVELAVDAACQAFKIWSVTPVEKRAKVIQKAADLLEARLEEFAVMESKDQGKPVGLARTVDIPRAVHNLRMFASTYVHHIEKCTYMDSMSAQNFTSRLPAGVAGLISPWNLPLYLLTFKLAPALMCGCTVVCKPSEMTSVTAWMLCDVLQQAGLPDGVVNMVFGVGPKVGDAMVRHPKIPLISFTGSTATANHIRLASANLCKKLSLELGGKNAAVVFGDADLEKCIPATVRSSFANQGEICLCTSRIYVHSSIYSAFLVKFVAETRKIKVGDPGASDTSCGALVSRDHYNKVTGYIDLARQEGGHVCCGYGVDKLDLPEHNKNGYFVAPTVIINLPDSSRVVKEEIFGPVTCIVPFDNEKEVIERVNGVEYGLCSTIWTRSLDRAHRMSKQLQVGTVWINCWLVRDLHMPFGGMKNSGIGREGTDDSIDFYTEVKTICVKISED